MTRLAVSLVAPVLFVAAVLPSSRVSVLVVSEAGVQAYADAVGGAVGGLPAGTFRVLDAGSRGFDRDLASAMESGEPQVAIAIGKRAAAALRAYRGGLALVVVTAPLRANGADSGVHRVELDIPPAAQLAAMRALWPGRTRAGLIRHPGQSAYSVETLQACARKEGFSLLVVECDGPAHLLKAMAWFQGKVDFVWCEADPDLYNAATVKPLVLASLAQRLPLVGFSPAFVRAGAAAGMFPDYADLGRQAAELALRVIRGEEHAAENRSPRVLVAVNQRVVRLLGLEFRPEAVAAEVYR